MLPILAIGFCLGSLLTLFILMPLLRPPAKPEDSCRGLVSTIYTVIVSVILMACIIYIVQNH